jgi:hypothetical protein
MLDAVIKRELYHPIHNYKAYYDMCFGTLARNLGSELIVIYLFIQYFLYLLLNQT